MPRKKKQLQEISQTHGKLENIQYKSLDQIWGDTGLSKYKTTNLEEYTNFINEMNKSDLQAHANKIGLVPIDNREMLTKRLIAEFRKFISTFNVPKNINNSVNLDKKSKDILAEGR
ncbi:MAG: hypothetical protein EBR82_17595 [Caulobacteraceae bacterium]|nr:hypothetical protein [Caulobacteraceae bacterium]